MKGFRALRQSVMTRAMKLASARKKVVEVSALRLLIAPGVCNPAPALGMSFAPLFEAGVERLSEGDTVLDLGTGCGVWALMAVRAGATVTATDLSHVSFEVLRESAEQNRLDAPRLLHGDLFTPVADERFDRILFNPPFHIGEPKDDADKAYYGGGGGEVVRRFLAECTSHLKPRGSAFVILPRTEQDEYGEDLQKLRTTVSAHQWAPVLGRAELIEIRA